MLALPFLRRSLSLSLTFIDAKNVAHKIACSAGESLLDISQRGGLEVEGACEGVMACTTCHMIFNKGDYLQIGQPSEEELDTLDVTEAGTQTSRLGCQVKMTPAMDKMVVTLPQKTINRLLL